MKPEKPVICVRLSPRTISRLDQYVQMQKELNGLRPEDLPRVNPNRSDLIRQAIQHYLANHLQLRPLIR